MKRLIIAACLLSLTVSSDSFALTLSLSNKTDWEIHELYFGKSSEKEWGKDYLGKNVIEPGSGFELSGIEPGKWDLRLVDEDGDDCVVQGVKIAASEDVELTNEMLLNCQKKTASDEEDS